MTSHGFLLVSLVLVFLISTALCSENPNLTPPSPAHAQLKTYGFPIGLLPSPVVNYTVNQDSGKFSVDLGGACKFLLPPDNYLATYSKRVTGKIVQGKIGDLEGIRVWAFFRWWSITGIRSSGDNLVFEVGVATAKYPAKNFDVTPVCEAPKHSSS